VSAIVPVLPPRLAAVASEIPAGSRVADIGTDHGRLPLWLGATGRAAYCLATEKTPALLARVVRAEAGTPWAARIAYRAGDGLAAILPGDRIDTVVLAGLGGRTIVRLLDEGHAARPKLRRLVLQPRSEAASVRRWLSEHGWRPVSERLVGSRERFHLTIAAEPGDDADVYRNPALDRDDLFAAGPLLVRTAAPELSRLLLLERERFGSILARAGSGAGKARARSELARTLRLLAAISPRAG
jgi:tRNA (adenine22-N1)-methyltransferase